MKKATARRVAYAGVFSLFAFFVLMAVRERNACMSKTCPTAGHGARIVDGQCICVEVPK